MTFTEASGSLNLGAESLVEDLGRRLRGWWLRQVLEDTQVKGMVDLGGVIANEVKAVGQFWGAILRVGEYDWNFPYAKERFGLALLSFFGGTLAMGGGSKHGGQGGGENASLLLGGVDHQQVNPLPIPMEQVIVNAHNDLSAGQIVPIPNIVGQSEVTTPTIEIEMIYSPLAVQTLGGQPAAELDAQNRINHVNQVFQDSGAVVQVHEAGFFVDNSIDETKTSMVDVVWQVQQSTAIAIQANQDQADMKAVQLEVTDTISPDPRCGSSFELDTYAYEHPAEARSMNVIASSIWEPCTTTIDAMVHELSHALGGAHPGDIGLWAFSHGWCSDIRDVMAIWNSACSALVDQLSGPRVVNGQTIGDPDTADMARTDTLTAPFVANYWVETGGPQDKQIFLPTILNESNGGSNITSQFTRTNEDLKFRAPLSR